MPPRYLPSVTVTIRGECDDGPQSLFKKSYKWEERNENCKAHGMEMRMLENVIKQETMNQKRNANTRNRKLLEIKARKN